MNNFNSQQIVIKNRKLKVLGQLGSGSQGVVFKVMDEKSKEILALKVQNQVEEKEWEISQKLSKVSHRNIVNIIDCQKIGGYFYFLMDCCDQDLYQSIQQQVVDQKDLRYILVSIADGIQFLHMNEIIHRDLKPENILIKIIKDPKDPKNAQKVYKIADFGLSSNQNICQTQQIGTCYYMAPELIKGENYNNKVDIWSLGAISYELITNKPLFDGKSQTEIFNQIQNINQEINQQELQKKLSIIQEEYRFLVMNMLNYNPQIRSDIKQVLVQLRDRYRSPPGIIQLIKPNIQNPKITLHNQINYKQTQDNNKNVEQVLQIQKFMTPNQNFQNANANFKYIPQNQSKPQEFINSQPTLSNKNVCEQKNQINQNEFCVQNPIQPTVKQNQLNKEQNINNFHSNQKFQITNMNTKQFPNQTPYQKEEDQFKIQYRFNTPLIIANQNVIEKQNHVNQNEFGAQNPIQKTINQNHGKRCGSPQPQTFQNSYIFQIRAKSP